ncbi:MULTISPECIES: nucleotide exchange factor GrpE [unclassified Amycolatopsis]|uniref:nucleotide exchange factor GrpE n=1 Tax=unclassified Amycolatopsis TaxID=2618356 RepID=UPI002E11A8C5|nr:MULTISPECIES: nucleotide exchange factor GrpE [unclassified Amycolatopsis]WSJ78874.1 nucleotide exchange factor GrpE [Amycolatopsis sp. NBC_01307]WSK77560.1 nucleotide exchange factor GrpE [Amycolatopsis sp. NBC_01286]
MATTGRAAEQGEPSAEVAGAGTDSRPQEVPAPATGAEEKLAELEDRWRRAAADLDNVRKRQATELRREVEAERARVAAAWLPVLDNLELALAHAEADPSAIVQGVRATREQAVRLLAGLGYPRDDETGVRFDPNRHEVVAVVEDPATEPNTVTHVVRPGYGTDRHQLRPTAVAVSKSQG